MTNKSLINNPNYQIDHFKNYPINIKAENLNKINLKIVNSRCRKNNMEMKFLN